jgi:hypothetical protein
MILGCDWIKQHNPIALDFRDTFRHLIIQKDGTIRVIFKDFTAPPVKPLISASKLEKFCRTKIIWYVIQVNTMQQETVSSTPPTLPLAISVVL